MQWVWPVKELKAMQYDEQEGSEWKGVCRRRGRSYSQGWHHIGPSQSDKGFEFDIKCTGKLSKNFNTRTNCPDFRKIFYYSNVFRMDSMGQNWVKGMFCWASP